MVSSNTTSTSEIKFRPMAVKLKYFLSFPELIFVCEQCHVHLARKNDLISTMFQGQSGTAYLFETTFNVLIDPSEQDRLMTTGRHIIHHLKCQHCDRLLGWQYVKAFEEDQKYKEGKFILELAYLREIDNSLVEIPQFLQGNRTPQSKHPALSMKRALLQQFVKFRKYSSHTETRVPFNEPGGVLFEKTAEQKQEVDWAERFYICGYLGGLAVFAFLWQYRPDTSAESWGKAEALKRMTERGVDLSALEDDFYDSK